MPLSPGQVLNNRYRVVKLLGQGGFGAVYRVWDINLERPRALKENLDSSPEAQRQFKREAQILTDLTHQNLPKVMDYFILPGQGQYLVMEYVEGEDLGEMLGRVGGPLEERQVLAWIDQVCAALEYLHAQNPPIIHRDIKPANIKITPEGKAMLVDFGIAKVYDPKLSTTLGARAATPGYAPFEQYGMDTTDERTDVYALGATLYHLLTGEVPVESIARMKGQALPSLRTVNPAISPETENAIINAIAVMPKDRYRNIRAFGQDLRVAERSVQPTGDLPMTITASTGSAPLNAAAAIPGILSKPVPWGWISAITIFALVVIILLVLAFGIGNGGVSEEMTIPERTQTALALIGAPEVSLTSTSPQTTETVLSTATDTPSSKPKQTIISPTSPTSEFHVSMVLIPAGDFWMGSNSGNSDEDPIHTVYLDDYYIDVYEVTNADFHRCVDERACSYVLTCGWGEPTYQDADKSDHPVVCVDWEQAQTYCSWRGGRLPTEAEWEKAARGGLEGMLYPWGNEEPVCTPGTSNGAQYDDCDGNTVSVGTFSANGYGLFDMAGNAWEWVVDWYDSRYYDRSQRENPTGPSSSDFRVLRGGSWYGKPDYLRAASRFVSFPTDRHYAVGFRCVADTPSR